MHQDLVFNTAGSVGRKLDLFIRRKGIDRLDQADRADTGQILEISPAFKFPCYVDNQPQVSGNQRFFPCRNVRFRILGIRALSDGQRRKTVQERYIKQDQNM